MVSKGLIGRIRAESPRHADWLAAFGGDTVPLSLIPPVHGAVPGMAGEFFYKADLSRFTPEAVERLVGHLSQRFALTEEEVRRSLDDPEHGLPVLTDDVSLEET